jgi:hypothetical protein
LRGDLLLSRVCYGCFTGRNHLTIWQIGGRSGATGGLGYETALALAKAEAELVLTGPRQGQTAADKISREVLGARISYEPLDPRIDR